MFISILLALILTIPAFGQNKAEAPPAEATTHYPNVIHADLPLYPPLPWTAHIGGTVDIQVTVEKGSVVDAQVKSSTTKNQVLLLKSVENVKTWQFRSEDHATFVVRYVYQIVGEQTPLPENPKIELDLPLLVKITAKPFKPTCSDCGADVSGKPVAR